ncbi:MAG: helix-turn-helix domain-containing protein, partial [Candidatus Dormibacteria bacterium]
MEELSTQRKTGAQTPRPTVLDRGLDVLEALLAEAPAVCLDSLAVRIGMPKPTLHRILATFVRRGYVVQSSRGTYGP